MKQRKDEVEVIGKDEMNLAEFPITVLSKRHDPDVKTLEFIDIIKAPDGKEIKREWIVTGSDKYGLPLAIDNDVLLALLFIGKNQNFENKKIYFTRYKLCEFMQWEPGGSAYRRIEESLDRLTGMKVKAKNAFWDNEKKGYVTKHFGIIDDYELFDVTASKFKKQDSLPFSYVNINEVIYDSIKAGYIKNIDTKKYFAFNSSISKRLFRYLDKKAYGKNRFEINLFTLAYTHLGFDKEMYKFPSMIKQKLDPTHEELKNAKFILSTEYQKTADGLSEKVVYIFPGKETTGNELSALTINKKLLDEMVKIGITPKVAEQLLKEFPDELIEKQTKALPHRKAGDPAAMLIKSIQGAWSIPAEYEAQIKKKRTTEEEKKRAKDEEVSKAEHRKKIEYYLLSLKKEELDELTRQAEELSRKEGGNVFKNREIPEQVMKAYIHILVEKNLNQ